jgi:hypothetical protein
MQQRHEDAEEGRFMPDNMKRESPLPGQAGETEGNSRASFPHQEAEEGRLMPDSMNKEKLAW